MIDYASSDLITNWLVDPSDTEVALFVYNKLTGFMASNV